MAEILPNASYVRHSKGRQDQGHERSVRSLIAELDELEEEEATRIWELLETPQTVDSLCRSLGKTEDRMIRSALAALYDKDMIQVSPDT